MIEIRPLGTRIIVKKEEAEETTASGIFLTGTSKRESIWAEVVAVGPGTEEEPMLIQPGDKVVYPDFGGKQIFIDDAEYSIYNQEDILAIVTETEE